MMNLVHHTHTHTHTTAWLREASYTSLRLGLYGPIKKAMGVGKDSHFLMKFSAGSLAGALGSVVGNPFDVLKTKLMAAEGKVCMYELYICMSCMYGLD